MLHDFFHQEYIYITSTSAGSLDQGLTRLVWLVSPVEIVQSLALKSSVAKSVEEVSKCSLLSTTFQIHANWPQHKPAKTIWIARKQNVPFSELHQKGKHFFQKTIKNTVEMRQIRFFQQKHHKTQVKTSHEVTLHVTYSGKSCRFLLRINHFDFFVGWLKKMKYSPNGWFKQWWF